MVTMTNSDGAYVDDEWGFDFPLWLDDAHTRMRDGVSFDAWDLVEDTARLMAMNADNRTENLVMRIRGRCEALEVLCGHKATASEWCDLIYAHSTNYDEEGSPIE